MLGLDGNDAPIASADDAERSLSPQPFLRPAVIPTLSACQVLLPEVLGFTLCHHFPEVEDLLVSPFGDDKVHPRGATFLKHPQRVLGEAGEVLGLRGRVLVQETLCKAPAFLDVVGAILEQAAVYPNGELEVVRGRSHGRSLPGENFVTVQDA